MRDLQRGVPFRDSHKRKTRAKTAAAASMYILPKYTYKRLVDRNPLTVTWQ